MLDKIDCEECSASIVKIGMCSTEVYYYPITDKDGRIHHHDNNSISASFVCENGHRAYPSLKPPKCTVVGCDFGDSYTDNVRDLMCKLYRQERAKAVDE
jgi:hypothetical protein